jgi:hypothetical protein
VRRVAPLTTAGAPRGVSSLFAAATAVFVLGTAAPASAQEWLKDRSFSEGPGVRAGDFEIHPAIGAQVGYDSNWFLRSDKSATGISNRGPQATPELMVTPSISLSTLGAQRKEGGSGTDLPPITFRATASGTYHEYFGQLTPEQRNGNVDATMNVGFLPGRSVGGSLALTYDRVLQPNSTNPSNPDLSFTRDMIAGSAELALQPGGGTLDWHFGGSFGGALFEQTGGQGYNNLTFGAFTRGRWKFRPKTAFLFDANLGFQNYTNTSGGVGTISALHSSDPVRTRIGLNGLITPRLSLLAMVGYGGSFFSPGSDSAVKQYDSVIAQSELKIFLTAPPEAGPGGVSLSQSTLAIGYTRDFQTSYLTDFSGLDRGYLKFAYFFAGRALISLEGGAAAIEYPATQFLNKTAESAFTDARIDATLYGEYRFTSSFALTATAKYTTNLSNTVLTLTPVGAGGVADLYAMQWQRFEAYLGARLFL